MADGLGHDVPDMPITDLERHGPAREEQGHAPRQREGVVETPAHEVLYEWLLMQPEKA